MDSTHLFAIAKILDNEYIGADKTFTAERKRGCWHLSTNKCDMASFIKVWEKNNKVSSIEILLPDSDGWQPITSYSWARVEKYLNSLN